MDESKYKKTNGKNDIHYDKIELNRFQYDIFFNKIVSYSESIMNGEHDIYNRRKQSDIFDIELDNCIIDFRTLNCILSTFKSDFLQFFDFKKIDYLKIKKLILFFGNFIEQNTNYTSIEYISFNK